MIRTMLMAALLLAVGCSKKQSDPVAVAPTSRPMLAPPVVQKPTPDPALIALRQENAQLRAQLKEATDIIAAWKAWSEKQSALVKQAQPASQPKPLPSARPAPQPVSQLQVGRLEVSQRGPFYEQDDFNFFETRQILGPEEMIVVPVGFTRGSVGATQFGGQAARSTPPRKSVGKPFLVQGLSTANLTDNQKVKLSGLFDVIGTRRLGDGRTLWVVSPAQ